MAGKGSMNFSLGKKSLLKLQGVHPDLVSVVAKAINLSEIDFTVLEGLRSKERQQELYSAGASKTLRSRHLTGHAVDLGALINGKVAWDWPLYDQVAQAMKQSAFDLGVPLTWGGDWVTFKDGPHFELPHKEYPA